MNIGAIATILAINAANAYRLLNGQTNRKTLGVQPTQHAPKGLAQGVVQGQGQPRQSSPPASGA